MIWNIISLGRIRTFEWNTRPKIPQHFVRFKQYIQTFCSRSIPNTFSCWCFSFLWISFPDFGREKSVSLENSTTNDVFIPLIINELDKITAFDLILPWFTACLHHENSMITEKCHVMMAGSIFVLKPKTIFLCIVFHLASLRLIFHQVIRCAIGWIYNG